MDEERQIVERRRGSRAGVAVSLAVHAALVLFLALHLTLDLPEAPKEDSVAVELVEPPKPPPPPQEEKQARMPVPKPAPARPQQPQAFESGAAEPQVEKPDAASAAEARKPAAAAQGGVKPAPKPQMTPKAVDALRARLQAAEAEQSGEPAPAPETAADSKPADAGRDTAAEAEKEGQDKGKAETGRMKEAKEHFSKRMLSDPRVKAALGQLPPERRIVQICSIEALEQVRHAHPDAFPDLLVPFSTGGGLIEDHVLTASGGAYRGRQGWFGIDYRCEVDAQTTRIVSFRYGVGAAIPRSEWARRKLPMD